MITAQTAGQNLHAPLAFAATSGPIIFAEVLAFFNQPVIC